MRRVKEDSNTRWVRDRGKGLCFYFPVLFVLMCETRVCLNTDAKKRLKMKKEE